MLPTYLVDASMAKQNHEIIGNLREGLTIHLIGKHPSNLVLAKDIVCTLTSSQSVSSK